MAILSDFPWTAKASSCDQYPSPIEAALNVMPQPRDCSFSRPISSAADNSGLIAGRLARPFHEPMGCGSSWRLGPVYAEIAEKIRCSPSRRAWSRSPWRPRSLRPRPARHHAGPAPRRDQPETSRNPPSRRASPEGPVFGELTQPMLDIPEASLTFRHRPPPL